MSDLSDHLPIITVLHTDNFRDQQTKVEYVRDFKNVNRDAFNQTLEEFNNIDVNALNINEKFNRLQEYIDLSINKYAPLKKKLN